MTFPYDRRVKWWFDPVLKHELHRFICTLQKYRCFLTMLTKRQAFDQDNFYIYAQVNWGSLKQDSVWLRPVHYHKHMIAYINVLHEHLHHAACIVLLSAVLWAALDHSSPMRLPIWAAWVRWMWTTGIWALILAQCDPAVLSVCLTALEIRHADGPAAERPVKSESV